VWGLRILVHQIAYLFAIATGIVSSGMIASLWAVLTDELPDFKMLVDGDDLAFTKVPLVVLSAPTTLITNSFWWLIERPMVGLAMLLGGLIWSFFQGVFILTQIFGVT
jgi:hypothetical protein